MIKLGRLKFLLSFLVFVFFLTEVFSYCEYKVNAASVVKVKQWEEKKNVSSTKTWTIKCNTQLDSSSVDKAISVTDSAENIVNVRTALTEDGKSILVYAPEKKYITGETYYLNISQDLKFIYKPNGNGQTLKNINQPVQMKFTINEMKNNTNQTNSTQEATGEKKMITMNITVGNKTFTAKMYNNETTQAFIKQLPMTVNMSELNGREKYYHLSSNLSAESTETPATINAGEIMCWSSNNLVLFYNTFSNSYGGYIKLGYIEDVSGLASALGTGNVQVTFAISD